MTPAFPSRVFPLRKPGGKVAACGQQTSLARMGKCFHAVNFFILRLRMYIFKLRMCIFKLRICIFRLKMKLLAG